MKPTVTLLGYALVIIGLINCEKNNPSSESNNYIIVVDKKSFISSSAIVELPGNPVLKDMKAVLLGSEGIFFSNKEGNNLSIKGNGMLLGFIIPNSFEFVFLQITAGIITIQSVSQLYRRANLFISVGQIVLVYLTSYIAFTTIQEGTLFQLNLAPLGLFMLNGLLMLFVQPLIYIYERNISFHITKDLPILKI